MNIILTNTKLSGSLMFVFKKCCQIKVNRKIHFQRARFLFHRASSVNHWGNREKLIPLIF